MTFDEASNHSIFNELRQYLEKGAPQPEPQTPKAAPRTAMAMTKEEFYSLRKVLDLSQTQLAQILATNTRTIHYYETGKAEPPKLVAKVLHLMVQDPVFRSIVQGNGTYPDSDGGNSLLCSVYASRDKVKPALQTHEASSWLESIDIQNITGTSSAMQITMPCPNGVVNE